MKTTKDGGYIAVGSFNGQPTIVKFSSTGVIQWGQSSNDGAGGDYFRSVIQTKTGDYVASGVVGGNNTAYVAKFSATGAVLWVQKLDSPTTDWSVGFGIQ